MLLVDPQQELDSATLRKHFRTYIAMLQKDSWWRQLFPLDLPIQSLGDFWFLHRTEVHMTMLDWDRLPKTFATHYLFKNSWRCANTRRDLRVGTRTGLYPAVGAPDMLTPITNASLNNACIRGLTLQTRSRNRLCGGVEIRKVGRWRGAAKRLFAAELLWTISSHVVRPCRSSLTSMDVLLLS